MRRRSPSYSPPPRRGRGRSRSRSRSPSPRGRYAVRREPPTSLLVRNLPKNCRAEDLRGPFKRFGPLRDIYLPKDYYTGQPRGFGFVQFLDPSDAEEAQYYMNHQLLYGRELTVVFAEENRKRPAEMRSKERQRGRGFSEDDGRSYFPHRGRSKSRSRSRTPPRGHRFSRSPSYNERRAHEFSPSDSPARSPSPERYQHKSRRHERRRSHSDSKRSRGERSHSHSPVRSSSPVSRHPHKGSKQKSRSDSKRLTRDRSHSATPVHSPSPVRHSVKGRQESPFHCEMSSPNRYSRSPLRSSSLPPSRGHSSRSPDSRSRSPNENRSQDGGTSPEHSSMDD